METILKATINYKNGSLLILKRENTKTYFFINREEKTVEIKTLFITDLKNKSEINKEDILKEFKDKILYINTHLFSFDTFSILANSFITLK